MSWNPSGFQPEGWQPTRWELDSESGVLPGITSGFQPEGWQPAGWQPDSGSEVLPRITSIRVMAVLPKISATVTPPDIQGFRR